MSFAIIRNTKYKRENLKGYNSFMKMSYLCRENLLILSISFGMLLRLKSYIKSRLQLFSKNRFPKDKRLNVNKEIGIN